LAGRRVCARLQVHPVHGATHHQVAPTEELTWIETLTS
jgi:hypothetical protein